MTNDKDRLDVKNDVLREKKKTIKNAKSAGRSPEDVRLCCRRHSLQADRDLTTPMIIIIIRPVTGSNACHQTQ